MSKKVQTLFFGNLHEKLTKTDITDLPDEETADKVMNGMHKKRVRGMKIRVERAMISKSKVGGNLMPRSFSISSSSLSSSPKRKHRKASDQKDEEIKSLLSVESCNPRIRERSYMRSEEVDEGRRERLKYESDIKDYTLSRVHHINAYESPFANIVKNQEIVNNIVEDKENNKTRPKTIRQRNPSIVFNYKSLTPEENERINKLLNRVYL